MTPEQMHSALTAIIRRLWDHTYDPADAQSLHGPLLDLIKLLNKYFLDQTKPTQD